MLINGIAKTFVSKIPSGQLADLAIPSHHSLLRIVDIIPLNPVATFDEDIWDFSACFRDVNSERHVISFSDCPTDAKMPVKLYALHLLDSKTLKVRSASPKIRRIVTFITSALTYSHQEDFHIISTSDYLSYFNEKKSSLNPRTVSSYISEVIEFYEFLNSVKIRHIINLQELKIQHKNISLIAKHVSVKHYPDIPDELFEICKLRLDALMRDENKPEAHRLTSGIILMNTQMGLRRSEIPIIKTDMIGEIETSSGIKKYAQYMSLKASRHIIEPKLIKIVCTPLLERTYSYYLQLRERIPEAALTNNLYVQPGVSEYPIKRSVLGLNYQRIMALYVPEVKIPWENIKPVHVRGIGNAEELFYIPNIHSIRVHVASVRARQGYPILYIEQMLSHAFSGWNMGQNDGYYSGAE